MIGFLTGKLISSKPTQIILDVNGVGYLVNISITTFEKISEKETASLFIHTSVKEDSITLFGFFTQSEKEMFELLISISGIGPKVSLGILSGISVDDLKDAIANGNVSRLIAIPGIGRKTAERVVLELRNKVDSIKTDGTIKEKSAKDEAISALATLGYQRQLAEKVVRDLLSENQNYSLEELIRKALAGLNK
ncbi:MAG: Holliday junction branch migration protein RuvA [Ignavibacteriaceae bacterium]|mgnify:FL=1|nr:Holliday junction branch migration protein RuvA [Ignavibacterium sp.]MCC6253306.1 Holliday junction branch migration protein RuvA [Ignavibacteriaceae bacterium]HMN23322.1 Holliday junction branch migration protein RuvA [Ignavibacteriaceae bacterium]HRN27253.1 Holliday junction branch migration protein RuvA [Ignavibacteriaceae bacterium]HRP91383.1 Holliday junction branch migration protein RuvA [Ignavibacteriaceae bacterium]